MKLNNQFVTEILTGFIRDELYRIGIRKAVIGLSGGIDSAVSAYLTSFALRPENVTCVLMPYKTSNPESFEHAQLVVNELGVNSRVFDITSICDEYFNKLDVNITKLRKGNIMARVRMITLYDISAELNALVIGTGNKTEILLGYTTLFGDSACAINPIGDLFKTQVRDLAKFLNVPDPIIQKKPSADLWEGQTDEGEMGFTYEEVDTYLFEKIDQRHSEEELLKMGFEPIFMKKVNDMIIKNQFKRLPPVIAKISNRTVNVDFRYNRDWNT
ncbi:MAG: NAD+ synthase [Ignavibacteriaceae bacterium]|jgi:NH(3)-dependent NAD(+) synthetase (EC 6.3.1.5)|nr:MAG: NAD+ synthase [Chlorobiota bacterium]KXK03453.1 MAG: NAD+ synthetase [Chlorobi bacterium OLB4]MBV6398984.1 NH(3)-dependent NAD(+) synthetase [Ignavibacteria bacterium]MCC6886179.1 NAD+ synthase [Ignavibacteriales bacterium]MDL1887794.1 NAD+ synthase [Ignavibacteria bacterium CHB1]MEB2328828.1 NAD+ synthase [Ignavibacteriaceae bacterium]OQY77116.1 MAG: NAD(+) synthetase [Ignavibacteriales bacterium UTCHB1]